jgi:hypothetical protein
MDSFERYLVRQLTERAELDTSEARYEKAVSSLRARRQAWRWGASLVGLIIVVAIIAFVALFASQVLPPPNSPLTVLLWSPLAVVALLVLLVWAELWRATL